MSVWEKYSSLFKVSWLNWEKKNSCNLKTLEKNPMNKSIKFLFRVKTRENNGAW